MGVEKIEVERFVCEREGCGKVQDSEKPRYRAFVRLEPLNEAAKEDMPEAVQADIEVCKTCKNAINKTIDIRITRKQRKNGNEPVESGGEVDPTEE